jgi:hypothetical protein
MVISDFDDMESSLKPVPRFPVEPPDGRKEWKEIDRQATLRKLVRIGGPSILMYANANAGKRNPALAAKEGIMGGVFDLTAWWNRGSCCPEMKGYDKNGTAGKLSSAQIDWGNRMHDMGWPVACFFDPYNAYDWMQSVGAPLRNITHGEKL